jgi:shikimate kinase
MTIFIVGVSCVGKTAVGKELSELLDYHFFDLDDEIENFFSTPIEKLTGKIPGHG